MTDSKALRKLIESRGLKYKYLAKKVGLTPYGLQRKIDNLSEFKTSEVAALCSALGGISTREKQAIFFAEIVAK